MPFQPSRPYNDLPSLPPREDVETKAVLKACIAARAAVAELRVSGQLIPNQAVLINSIPLLEAQASSEIENIVTTTDRLFRFANEVSTQADPATKEALRYRTALSEGFQTLKQISEPLITQANAWIGAQDCSRDVEEDVLPSGSDIARFERTAKVWSGRFHDEIWMQD